MATIRMWQDEALTVPAGDGDPVAVLEEDGKKFRMFPDQSGRLPTRDGDLVRVVGHVAGTTSTNGSAEGGVG